MKVYKITTTQRRGERRVFYITAEDRKSAAKAAAKHIEFESSDFSEDYTLQKVNKYIYTVTIPRLAEQWRFRIDKAPSGLILTEQEQ